MSNTVNKKIISFFAIWFAVYGYISINMGLPAYPTLQHVFHSPNSHVKLAMTGFLCAFAFAQLVWGPLSDRYGRRPIALIATSLAVIGSLLTALAPTLSFFIVGRIIEGLGAGFTTLVAKAILLDRLTKKEMHLTMTYVVSTVAVMPAIAPLIGGEILNLMGWRSIYFLLAAVGLLVWIMTFFILSETIVKKVEHLTVTSTITTYFYLLKNIRFVGYFLPFSLTLSGLIVFYAVAPYIYINYLHVAANHYGYVLLFVGLSYMGGAALARIASMKLSSIALVVIGFILTFGAGIAMTVFTSLFSLHLLMVTLPMIAYAIGCGFVSPISNTLALAAVAAHEGGSASAIVNCVTMACSSALTAILASFSMATLYPLAMTFIIIALFNMMICLVANRAH